MRRFNHPRVCFKVFIQGKNNITGPGEATLLLLAREVYIADFLKKSSTNITPYATVSAFTFIPFHILYSFPKLNMQ